MGIGMRRVYDVWKDWQNGMERESDGFVLYSARFYRSVVIRIIAHATCKELFLARVSFPPILKPTCEACRRSNTETPCAAKNNQQSKGNRPDDLQIIHPHLSSPHQSHPSTSVRTPSPTTSPPRQQQQTPPKWY